MVLELLAKAVAGGVLVLAFALLAETLSPKRFAGVFAAAPSVALASLAVTVLAKGSTDARIACAGMVAGAIGFVVYCALAPTSMRRFGTLKGSAAALLGWFAVAAAVLPVAASTPAASAAAMPATAGGHRAARRQRPSLACEPGKIKDTEAKQWLVRFTFGAATSALAGAVGKLTDPVIGGAFLAFPAILLASLTLVRKKEGRASARDDARGAGAGALGLCAFAVVGAATFTHVPAVAAFVLATLAWAVVALGAYLLAWLTGHGADEED
jgi:drug/metabolite transporter (DMT)-like permease